VVSPSSGQTTTSGPAVARLYHCLLAIIFLIAWASLGVQVDVLIGSHGLLPVAPFLASAQVFNLVTPETGLPRLFEDYVQGSDHGDHIRGGFGLGNSHSSDAGLFQKSTASGEALTSTTHSIGG
jgi:hypothetical protein